MPQPDWDKIQKTSSRSPLHGKRDHDDGEHGGHGAHEKSLGAREEHPGGPQLVSVTGEPLAGASIYPTSSYIGYVPPVTDQGSTPQCVAHSNAYDQNHQDRPEQGSYLNFDKPRFFKAIGGTSEGASMTAALARRVSVGYPTVVAGSTGSLHRIKRSELLSRTSIEPFKSVIAGKKRGVLRIGPWFHSWFHPLASGKLPTPDYLVGWHATWFRGYNDLYGGRLRNSWGTDYGLSGDVFMPYSYMLSSGSMWFTTDTDQA